MGRWDKWTVRGSGVGGRPASRRAFLGGAGTMLTLPWLGSLASSALADTGDVGAAPLRLLFWYVPNGMRMEHFRPTGTGAGYTTSPLLAPLDAMRQKFLVLSNVNQLAGADSLAGDHARGTASFLTAQRAARPEEPVLLGPSVDYLASLSSAADGTPYRSLQLATANQPTSGNCDSGYACAYQNSITWSGPDTPVPPRTDPRTTFDALFAGNNPLLSLAAQQRRHDRRESVLDYVLAESQSLGQQLSTADQIKLEQYMDGVRDLEIRLENNPPNQGSLVCDPGQAPEGYNDIGEQIDQFVDILVKAIECDSTRVLSMMADSSGSNRSFGFIGVPEAHHEMSHWATGTVAEQAHRKDQWGAICGWHVQQFGMLLERLDAIQEDNGSTLLDNTLCYFSSEISDGNAHNHNDMPVILAGGGSRVNSGRHVEYATAQPIADLFLGMLEAFGAPQSTFGMDGTQTIPDVFT